MTSSVTVVTVTDVTDSAAWVASQDETTQRVAVAAPRRLAAV